MLKGNGVSTTPKNDIKAGSYDEEFKALEEKYHFNKEHKILVAEPNAQVTGTYQVKYYDGFKDAPRGSIGIIPIQGVMMKHDYCGDAGSMTNAARVAEANNNPNIEAIVLKIDSPGGMVNGLPTLYDAIKNSKKPVLAFIDDGGMYSAAYYVASAADEIYSSNTVNGVGSIGTMQSIMDYREYLAKEGIKQIDIYAPQSTEKNKEYRELMDKENQAPLKSILKVYAQDFIDRVIEGRGDRLNVGSDHSAFKGAVYRATEAVEMGLIDGIMPLAQVLQRAAELAQSTQKQEGLYV
jgi:protease-4